MVFLIVLNIMCIYVFFIEPYHLEVRHISYPLPEGMQAYTGLRILHISDPHINFIGPYEKRVIKTINAVDADFICVTGDLIMYNQDFKHAISFLNQLRCKNAVYVVFGNSDYTNMRTFFRAIKKTPLNRNIFILRNDIADETYGSAPIVFAGLDDPISGYANYSAMPFFNHIPGLKILITHAYTKDVRQITPGIDLVLAGHTHGGQINILPRFVMKNWRNMSDRNVLRYLEGFHKDGNTRVNISRGIGMSFLPIRFRARPDVCVIEFK
jgi:predicted MPP superfamily phosphohydrolase